MWVWGGGILLFSPTVWTGSGGERRDTHRNTHTGTYTRMLHLPFSDLPLKKCPNTSLLNGFSNDIELHGLVCRPHNERDLVMLACCIMQMIVCQLPYGSPKARSR